jgi:DNA ligase-1
VIVLRYSLVADAYEKIENTTKRLDMTDYLVELLKITPKELIDKVVYLTQGKLYPDFIGSEIGIAEKLAIKAVAKTTGYNEDTIQKNLEKTGDLGNTVQELLEKKVQKSLFKKSLTVQSVFETLDKMSKTKGSGSIEQKINLLSRMLTDATRKEAKYILRTVTGELRLGIADMTVLDALAIAYGKGKDSRPILERAYDISSDLGKVAKVIVEYQIEGLKTFKITLGQPIRPMLAERLSSPKEILEKLGGRCIAEYKYDGERIQAHKTGDNITLFSRRLENITEQYPDVVKLIKQNIDAKKAIIESECVAIDPETCEMRPFQDLMHRRRKYGILKAIEEHPISLFIFDIVYRDGEDLTLKPFLVRHKTLRKIVKETERFHLTKHIITEDSEELEKFFEDAIEKGCEGLICKSIDSDSVYQAGSKGWLWIKYKRDYKSEMIDTIDLVIVGAFHGRGKRVGTYGALLLASYNPKEDIFETISKCGTGFKDEDLKKIPVMIKANELDRCHPRVLSNLDADVWFEPKVVLEVIGAEITLSPVHTCAMNMIRKGSGLAIRFPRFTGNYRLDKSAEDSTTTNEIVKMYRSQLKSRKD